jgi:hypothetical protein
MQSRYEYLKEKYVDTNIIDLDGLLSIVAADPTSNVTGEGDMQRIKAGKYTQWILKQYMKLCRFSEEGSEIIFTKNPSIFFEDLYKVMEDLQIYDRIKLKKHIFPEDKKDIFNIEDEWELFQLVQPHKKEEVVLTKAEVKQKVIAENVELIIDGERWDIISPKTKEAAVVVSGPPLTRWCTAADGYNHFENYHRQGKLYIIRDKTVIVQSGRGAGQPKPIWQFHFETNSFMDVDDRRVDIMDILQKNQELKKMFRPLMAKHFLSSKMVQIKYPNDNVSKFIVLYGFDEFLDSLSPDITELDIDCQGASPTVNFALPRSIRRFKKLECIYLQKCVSSVPEEIGELSELQNLSLPNNPMLKTLPRSLVKLKKLITLNIRGSVNVQLPNEIKRLDEAKELFIIHPQ